MRLFKIRTEEQVKETAARDEKKREQMDEVRQRLHHVREQLHSIERRKEERVQ